MTYSDMDPDVQQVRFEVRRFRQHFITFVAVVAMLFLVNLLTGGVWFWHGLLFWIVLIWGVILALEAVHLFGDNIGREWEDRMVDQVVARRRGHAGGPVYRPYNPPRPPSPPPVIVTPAPPSAGATPPPTSSPPPVIVTPPPPPAAPVSGTGETTAAASPAEPPAGHLTPPPPKPAI